MTEIATTQPANGQANGAPTGSSEGTGPAKSAVQKRIDKPTREKYELQADLERALGVIEKYRAELRRWRRCAT